MNRLSVVRTGRTELWRPWQSFHDSNKINSFSSSGDTSSLWSCLSSDFFSAANFPSPRHVFSLAKKAELPLCQNDDIISCQHGMGTKYTVAYRYSCAVVYSYSLRVDVCAHTHTHTHTHTLTHTQMFPVKVICGHRWGLHITATTAMPEAVLTGLAFSLGRRAFLWVVGTAAIMSTSLGCEERPYLLATSPFSLSIKREKEGGREGPSHGTPHLFKLTSLLCSWASISLRTISDTVITISSAWDACGPTQTKTQTGREKITSLEY